MIAPSYNGDTCQGLESGFAAKSKVALLKEITLMLRLGLKATQLASRLQMSLINVASYLAPQSYFYCFHLNLRVPLLQGTMQV